VESQKSVMGRGVTARVQLPEANKVWKWSPALGNFYNSSIKIMQF